jgi:hypothetical protein
VQHRLRHGSATTTLDAYGHLWPDADGSARAAVGAVLSGPVAGVLAGVAGLHALWGAAVAWPAASDRRQLADAVAGTEEMPLPGACFAVAGALLAAAVLVAGAGGQRRPVRLARAGVAVGLLARGVAGVTGATGLLVPWGSSCELSGPGPALVRAAVLGPRLVGRAVRDGRPTLKGPDRGSGQLQTGVPM